MRQGGEPQGVQVVRQGEPTPYHCDFNPLYRSACELVYENQGKTLKTVVCNKHTNPTLNGLPVFSAESITAWKEQYDYVENKYYLTIPDLGVCIGGMGGKKIPKGEDRLVIVFARSEIEYYKMFVQV